MSEVTTTNNKKLTVKDFMKSDAVQKSIKDTLGAKSSNFTASVLALVGQDELLAQAVPMTLLSSALTAAALDLPINKNLGFAHIIGYKNNRKGVVEAQFQMGWKGFVQLAQRSGHYKTINTSEIREGEIKKRDRLSGEIEFEWIEDDEERSKKPVIGYTAYFRLTTGFEKTLYMSKAEVEAHAKRYSQAYKSGYGPWKDDFDAMAMKTVVKMLISKWGPMSTELEKAMIYDQSVIKGEKAEYVDGDIELENTKATDDEEAAILAANGADDTPEAEVVEDTPAEEKPAPKAKAAPKKSVKEMADERWGNKGKQASLVDDNDSQS